MELGHNIKAISGLFVCSERVHTACLKDKTSHHATAHYHSSMT